jgi:ribosome recycling factor
MEDVLKVTEDKFKKAIESVKKNFSAVRTGRANSALLDHVLVDYYGTKVPVKQLASISIPEPRTIMIQPFDKNSVKDVERAIMTSDLGLPPNVDAGIIRLNIPQPTEERRKDLVKVVKKEAEDGKVSLRNIRREAIESLKKDKTKGALSEDQEKTKEEAIEKLVKKYTEEIDRLLQHKEKEVMEV